MRVNRYAEYLREVDYLSRREGELIRENRLRMEGAQIVSGMLGEL